MDVRGRRRGGAAAAALALLAGSCGTPPPARTLACAGAAGPPITRSPDGSTDSTTLSVLTYNIEGLGWPARGGRASDLQQIGERLAARRAAGEGPDIVVFQEMFSGAAKKAVMATGYPAITAGPRRTTRADEPATRDPLPGKKQAKRGEIGMHFTGSGLAVASRYPIEEVTVRAYGFHACAGFDCLANKGIMRTRVAIPGVPTPIEIFDTHLNSQRSSKASVERRLEAHNRQALEASRFIDENHDDALPLIFGGDFNMRHSEARWENFSRYQSLELVHRVCAQPDSGCDVKMSWDGDEPWVDTEDLQFFWNGETVKIQPIRVEALFDGGPSGPELSDHDGFMVTYRLSWPASANSGTCPTARS